MDPKVLEILFATIRTLEEAYHLDDELRLIQQMSFMVNDPTKPSENHQAKELQLAARVKELVSHKTYQVIQELEAKGYINASNPEELRLFFERAHKEILQMPRLQLQLAIEVNEQILTGIYDWVRREIKKKVLLDIITKPQVLAGCVIVYEGVFKDLSLRTMFEKRSADIFKPILKGIVTR